MITGNRKFAKDFWHAIGISEALKKDGQDAPTNEQERIFYTLWNDSLNRLEVDASACLEFFKGGFAAGTRVVKEGARLRIEDVKALLAGEV